MGDCHKHPEYNLLSDVFPNITKKWIGRKCSNEHHEVFGVYHLNEIFNLIPEEPENRDPKEKPTRILLGKFHVNVSSTRIQLFRRNRNNLKCVSCGLSPTHWVLERFKDKIETPPHLNLYALVEGEKRFKEILFTQDHIIPKSKGGSIRHSANLQVMCIRCNKKKGSRFDIYQFTHDRVSRSSKGKQKLTTFMDSNKILVNINPDIFVNVDRIMSEIKMNPNKDESSCPDLYTESLVDPT